VVKPYVPFPPSPKQRLALDLNDVEELFWGGAAGGGKTLGLIMLALQYVDVPGYSAAIFRLTKEDLDKPGSILDIATSMFAGTAAKWDGDAHAFRFPSGATIHFGYGQSKREIERRYQGPGFQMIGVDELGQWTEEAYRYLFSRLRRTRDVPVPLRMRPVGNPGGVGAEWIRARFADFGKLVGDEKFTVKELVAQRKRGEPVPDRPVFVSPPSTEAKELARQLGREAQGAHFLPAYPEDNPGLDVVEYKLQLARLDSETRQQLEHGDWWAIGGGRIFQVEWFHYLDAPPLGIYNELRFWDLAATKPRKGKDPDWSAGVRMGIKLLPTKAHHIIVCDAQRTREDSGGTEAFVRGVAEADGKAVAVYFEEEPGSAGKNNTYNYASKVLPGWRVEGVRKTGPKMEFWKPLAADAKNGMLWLVRGPWNGEFVGELCALTNDDTHSHDDMADAAGGGRSKLFEDPALAALRRWGT
jgi:predicted phage terminase large subunit-like protein